MKEMLHIDRSQPLRLRLLDLARRGGTYSCGVCGNGAEPICPRPLVYKKMDPIKLVVLNGYAWAK